MLHGLESSRVLTERDISVLFKERLDGWRLDPTSDEMRIAMAGGARSVAMAHSNTAALSAGYYVRDALRYVLGAARKEDSPRAVAAVMGLQEHKDHIASAVGCVQCGRVGRPC